MAAWFGSKKNDEDTDKSPANGDGQDAEKSYITVTDTAIEKITELIQGAESPVLGVRILAEATSPMPASPKS